MLSVLNIEKGYCCEFVAWDGKKYSNTFNLIKNSGWFGLLIEGSSKRYDELLLNIRSFDSVKALNMFVALEGENRLDAIFAQNAVPKDFDLLSIDIDGCD